jgi:hypothetical protein
MAVTIGTETIGFVVHRDGSYFAFDVNEQLVGEYRNQRDAMRSLRPAAGPVLAQQRISQ